MGHVIKLHPSSSTHPRRKRVRLQIPQPRATAQRKEKKEAELFNEEYNLFTCVKTHTPYVKRMLFSNT